MNILSDFLLMVWSQGIRQKFPLWICLGLLLNLIIAPVILARTNDHLTRSNAYALGLLGILTLALGIYLCTVIFQPEKF